MKQTLELENLIKNKPNWYVLSHKKQSELYKHQINLRHKIMRADIKKFCEHKKKSLLEIGCGDGLELKNLLGIKNLELSGCDYNKIRQARARKLLPGVHIFYADIRKGLQVKRKYDAVLLNHVLEHIQDDDLLLTRIHSLLKPGGVLFLGVPQEASLPYVIRNHVFEPYILWRTDHVHFYTSKTVLQKLENTGFQAALVRYFNYAFPHSIIDRFLRSSKFVHDVMEKLGKIVWYRMGAGAVWIMAVKT